MNLKSNPQVKLWTHLPLAIPGIHYHSSLYNHLDSISTHLSALIDLHVMELFPTRLHAQILTSEFEIHFVSGSGKIEYKYL